MGHTRNTRNNSKYIQTEIYTDSLNDYLFWTKMFILFVAKDNKYFAGDVKIQIVKDKFLILIFKKYKITSKKKMG